MRKILVACCARKVACAVSFAIVGLCLAAEEKTGLQALIVPQDAKSRNPTTEIRVEFGEVHHLSPWRIKRRFPRNGGARGGQLVTLRDAMLAINELVAQDEEMPEHTFVLSADGSLASICDIPVAPSEDGSAIGISVESVDGVLRHMEISSQSLDAPVRDFSKIAFVRSGNGKTPTSPVSQTASAAGNGKIEPRKTGTKRTITLPGGATMEMIWCAPGTFLMGSPLSEIGRFEDEPQHQVMLTKGFWLGKFEVTQAQWTSVMGANPSHFKGDKRPVECVSYNDIRGSSIGSQWPSWNAVDADSFLGKLRARTGVDFDLPTEAQWEYACRAGTTTDYNNGTNYGGNYNYDPNLNLLGRYWYNRSDGRDYSNGHTTVGSYQPNAWGLYDMLGNVCEWCLDWKGGSLSGNDPVGSSSGSYRVQRGGSWCDSDASGCTSSYQYSGPPSSRSRGTGFRLVGALPTQWTPQDYTITFDSAGGSAVPSITAASRRPTARP